MRRVRCSEVWGGIDDRDLEFTCPGLTASLYSASADGGRGGDVHYLSVCDHDALTRVAVADVVGHGRAVSDVSRWLYHALGAFINDLDSTAVLADVNRLAVKRGLEALTTAAIASFYVRDRSVSVAYAGHPPALLRRRGAARWSQVDLPAPPEGHTNLPLGASAETAYAQVRMELAPGDRMVVYTDGLVEARGPGGSRFGAQGLRAVLDGLGDDDLPGLKSALIGAVRRHAGGLPLDDVTLLALEVRG